MNNKFRLPRLGGIFRQQRIGAERRSLGVNSWICLAALGGVVSACSESGSSFEPAGGTGGVPSASGGTSVAGTLPGVSGSMSTGGSMAAGGSDSPSAGASGSPSQSGAPSAGQGAGLAGGSFGGSGGAPSAAGAPSSGGMPSAGTAAGGAPSAGTGAGGVPVAGAPSAGAPPVGGTGGSTAGPACPKAPAICHEFYAADNAKHVLKYVNEFEPSKDWSKSVSGTNVNSPRQIELVDNSKGTGGKAIMVSVDQGFEEYDLVTGARLRSVLTQGDVRGAIRLADGNTVLAVGNDTLRTVNAAGTQVSSCMLPGSGGDSLRVLNRDPASGYFLLGRLQQVFIVNQTCQQQWTATLPAGGKAYSVIPRAGGGVWATSGAPSTVVEFSPQSTILKQLGGKTAHPGLGLDFFSGFELLPNGNVLAANWQGHIGSPANTTPHLVEFDQTNKLVWRWGDQSLARQITNTLVIR